MIRSWMVFLLVCELTDYAVTQRNVFKITFGFGFTVIRSWMVFILVCELTDDAVTQRNVLQNTVGFGFGCIQVVIPFIAMALDTGGIACLSALSKEEVEREVLNVPVAIAHAGLYVPLSNATALNT